MPALQLPTIDKSLRITRGSPDRFVCSFFVLILFASISFQARAQQWDACDPTPEVRAGLDALPKQTPDQFEWGFHQKELDAIDALRHQHPDDPFIERRYINTMWDRTERPKVIDELKARFMTNPQSALAAYLYGLALLGRDSPESIKLFDGALEKDPKFPWPHISLVTVYSSQVFRDKSKADLHLRAFLGECPKSFEGYAALAHADESKEEIREHATRLRALLEKRDDADAISAYRTLWSLEFQATPTSDYDALRERTTRDVQRIRSLNLQQMREWYDALEDGFRLTKDQKNISWVRDEREIHNPSPWAPASLDRWMEDHQFPGEDAPAENQTTFYRQLLAETDRWIRERPNATSVRDLRLYALWRLGGPSPEEVEAAADQLFEVAIKNAGPSGPDSGVYFSICRLLAKKHLQPEKVLEMAQKGADAAKAERTSRFDDLYTDEKRAAEVRYYDSFQEIDVLGYMTEAYLQLKQLDKAQITLSRMDEKLQDSRALVGDAIYRKESRLEQLSVYWAHMARLAQQRQRKIDAMGFYENALLTRLDARQKLSTMEKDELAEDARKLWVNLGGTNEGWTLWYARRATELQRLATLRWDDANQPLAAFKLADLNGKTWSADSLKGKVTFLNFWASW